MKQRRIGNFKKSLLTIGMGILLILVLSSCSLFGKKDEKIIAPKLDIKSPPRIERVSPDYLNPETNKMEVYTDIEEGIIMPVNAGERVHIVIDYVNPSNLKINKVVLSGEGKQFEIASKDFLDGSDSSRTTIEFEIGETSGQTTYTITKIFYNLGSSVLSMTLNQDYVDMTVNVEPEFRLKLDYQNYDARTDTKGGSATIEVAYHQSLEDIIPSPSNQSIHEHTPTKLGGWAFMGYYTQPNGNGHLVTNSANFYFWKNTTLYAHYERLYNFTLSNATYDIPDGKGGNFAKFATITKITSAGDRQSTLEVYDTIADDNGEYPIVAIGDAAFDKTNNLRTIKIGKYVKTIGKDAFSSSKVETVEFHPQGVVEVLDNRAFYGTSNLGKGTIGFTLPPTVKFLGERCFENSSWGRTIERGKASPGTKLFIYPEITHIGNWCFVGTTFTEVIFMPGVKFKADAIENVPYIEQIDGETVVADSDYYLGWCLFKSNETITRFSTLTDPDQANGLEIIPAGMFDIRLHSQKNNVGLISVSFAEGLKVIGKGAFHYQKRLTELRFPDSLEDIGGDAYISGDKNFPGTKNEKSEFGVFQDCSSITSVEFGENSQLKTLGASAFRNNRLISKFDITSKVFQWYGDGPFQGCESLIEVNLANDVIAPQPLKYDRSWLEFARKEEADFFYPTQPFKVFVEDSVVEAMRTSFEKGASNYTKRSLPVFSRAMIKEIGDGKRAVLELINVGSPTQGWALGYYLGDEKEVVLPNSYDNINIIQIGPYAFNKNIERIRLPENIVNILEYAFAGCKKLREVYYGGALDNPGVEQLGRTALKTIGSNAFFDTAITYFIGGSNLETIGNEAFYACTELVWVDLKDSKKLTTTGTGAFNRCTKLRYVRMPILYNSMADATFANCTALKYLVFENTSPVAAFFGKTTTQFSGGISSNYIDVYVPSETAKTVYNGLDNLPSVMKNRFIYAQEKPSPDPGDFQISV